MFSNEVGQEGSVKEETKECVKRKIKQVGTTKVYYVEEQVKMLSEIIA